MEDDFIEQWQARHPLRRRVSVRLSGVVRAPLTYGLIRPVILLSADTDWRDRETLEFILAHEYVHIRRFDGAAKLVLTAAVCLHWFNPAAWLMYALANRDMELACDEHVVRALGADSRAAYARTLIAMEAAKSGLAPLLSHFSKNAMEERITAIMKIKKMTAMAAVASLLLVIGMTAVFATGAKEAEKPAEDAVDVLIREEEDLGIDAAAITDDEMEYLATLQPEGWEDMTVSEYRAWIQDMVESFDLDFAGLQAMLTELANLDEISALRDKRDDIHFLCYLAEPLLGEDWEEVQFFHYFVSSDRPWPVNNACIDLSIGLQVLKPDAVTLAYYDAARRDVLEHYQQLLITADDRTLADEEAFNELLFFEYADSPEGLFVVTGVPARRMVTDTAQAALKAGESVVIGREEMPEDYAQTNRIALTSREGGTFAVSVTGPGGESKTITVGGGETVLVYLHANGDDMNAYDITVENVGSAASHIAYSYDIFVAGQIIKSSPPPAGSGD